MPVPWKVIPEEIRAELDRYLSYDWPQPFIAGLIRRKYHLEIPCICVRAYAQRGPCPKSCRENCPFGQAKHPEAGPFPGSSEQV